MASEDPAAASPSAQHPKKATTPGKAPPTHVLACVFCHQRKIRCDRKSPCSNCIKTDQPCVPSKRAPAGAGRRRVVKDLLDRLHQCESLLSQVAPHDAEGRPAVDVASPPASTWRDGTSVDSPASSWVSYEEARKDSSRRPSGKIVVDEGRRTYMESPLHSNVLDHLQFSKLSLDDDDDDATKQTDFSDSATVVDANDGASVNEQESMDFDLLALGPVEILRLWQVFLERVNPMTKVIHVPSLEPIVFEAATDRFNVRPEVEALLCAVNVLGIMALTDSEAQQVLNVAKSKALEKSSLALKKALSRVDFLRKYNLTILQCLVLYLVSLQGQFDRHASWILTGTLVRIAQRMGLHRDGELLGLRPFETEMRRRIWWQIIMLETKYAILAGFCDTLLPPNWDAKLPSNVNDADLLPGSSEPVKSREGATEMALVLMLYESRIFFYQNPMSEFEAMILGTADASAETSKRISGVHALDKYRATVDQLEERLAEAEKKYCNPTLGGIHTLACGWRGFVVQKLRDMIAHARQPWDDDENEALLGSQQSFFRAWVIHFESEINWYDTVDEKFRWYLRLHLQSGALSVLIELLRWQQPAGTLVDRAWKAIDRVYHHHPELCDLGKKENVQRAENLLAGWRRREKAFGELGLPPCEVPAVIRQMRSSGCFPAGQLNGVSEQWPASAAESALLPGLGTAGLDGYEGNLLLDPNAGAFFWGDSGQYSQH
ncbi:Aurofusarin cluster transcription factor aurR2 [Colletotrichum trifolii]|uniref:Aurofusarin cluster transcription factor aurR2 n=1 Tax=Colletotrichum trifolii TaxID=5466 RepID=A0A4R8RLQ2_COLTR|nr:Aurofusarin cluster transcription factor aurR2 [Colletotrichum trifolii]